MMLLEVDAVFLGVCVCVRERVCARVFSEEVAFRYIGCECASTLNEITEVLLMWTKSTVIPHTHGD